jgi:CHAT domain-containing protein
MAGSAVRTTQIAILVTAQPGHGHMMPFLASGDEGRLQVREVFGMDLKASLVVLSGCETGLGKVSSGDDLVGLTRAFIYAGTPSVVASLWKVDDASTAHLMSSFYRNLKTKSKVEALRQAQLEMIRGKASGKLLAQRGVGGVGKLGKPPTGRSLSQDSMSLIPTSGLRLFLWATDAKVNLTSARSGRAARFRTFTHLILSLALRAWRGLNFYDHGA